MAKMLFSVGGSSGLGWDDYVQVAQACDELGFHGFYPSDHLGPVGRGGPTDRLDATTVLAALSGHTKRLRLGALVMGNHFRHPVMTAKIVGAIDHASGGRAELGIGMGGNRDEYASHGMFYKEALIQRMREVCGEAGRDFSTLRLSHQLTIQVTRDQGEAEAFYQRQVAQATRNPGFKLQPQYRTSEEQVRDAVIAGEPGGIRDGVGRWLDLGVTHLNIHTPRPFDRTALETISAKVMPAFA